MMTIYFFRLLRRQRDWLGWLAVFFVMAPLTLPAQLSSRRRHPRPAETASPAPSPTPEKPVAATPPPDNKSSTAEEVAPSKTDKKGAAAPGSAAVSSIEPAEIEGFDTFPEPVRHLLTSALELTRRNLTYTYGSADPASGGMDCSGTISYLLKSQGFDDVPRQANEQYIWTRRKSRVYPVLSKKADNFELNELRPGDLMFWSGTYNIDRDPPITHTMIYLGRRKKDGHRLMVGSSDGRPYDGQRRNGVSVFDFRMPAAREGDATAAAPDHAPDFAGYGPIPGIAEFNDAAERHAAANRESTDAGDAKSGERASRKKSDDEDTPKAKSSPTPRRSRRSRGG